jgi:HNH endonuclease
MMWPVASLFLSRLNAEQRNELVARLYEMQRGICFICEQPIDLAIHAGSLDIDHVEPLSAGGKDDEANLAITHDSCNRSKQASDLRVARVLARFASIQEEVRASDGRGANLSDILSKYGGAQYALKFRIEGNEFIYGQSEAGDTAVRKVPLWTDPLSGLRYFFAVLPIGYLHHDDRINPRNIGPNLSKLLTEFHRGRPQLHVSLAWIVSTDGTDKIKVFDGQHKATAQVLLGAMDLPVRVFVDPDPDLLLVANTNAGTTLRQVAFDKSVQRRLGGSLFRDRLVRYRHERGLSEDEMDFSEIDLYAHFKGEAREVKRYIIDNQRDQITSHPDNRLVEFMDYAGKGAEKPLSYSTIEKSFYSFFIYPNLLETPLDYGEDTGENPRELEIGQIVALMNILAEEVYVGKFDPVLGASRIESKVQKGESVPDEHLRAFRMAKEEVLYSWLKYVQQIVLHHFVALGMPVDDERLFQYRFSEVLWRQLRAYVHNLAGLPLWVNHELSATIFGGKQTGDFWRTIWETGNSPQGTAVLAARIDLTALTTIGEAVPAA